MYQYEYNALRIALGISRLMQWLAWDVITQVDKYSYFLVN